ncbi:Na(+)/H(+) antiporter subunit C [Salipaludibacillus agaradhaerens]|jgi:multicomponent Na+:H+ antiporter subunit C|uniref:Na(+)/H(+) antiporter subunit C n=1 Tax=Salipaludibacillus agaradhaerens TaxID=76935 RepID=A0A9Q4B1Y3_SALAG|nr:Na(+)/H(+) antiporter subunit C [Salipaludibacillus agaradhaerens]MCR6110347.1 Na(+)/H(+) antiporter subunit C [Bacillus sp. A301a_S52]UJW57414.1 Na(+)/H(+) antiporter subunit C [Bacillus sp. A116_S68]MCR6096824.1 Na(+)/H(+) antiporter subunit C [Salipaludibacillus agaradhaerens]MCR6106273.1 Na(+)/H(+) antiporter subunit C [Salipaludibacillus agaradhaerens]MCR6113617.1 Na(+)/H(+) antiporter subunit C [Salipaludibacillus agaradhaerens]
MEILMILTIGVLFTVATYLILSKSLLRVIIGVVVISHGAHLLLLTLSGLQQGAPPLLGEEASTYSDPLPQALILTAIVIGFGITAFMLVLAYRTYKEHKTDNFDELRGTEDE